MNQLTTIPISVLDLSPIPEGATARDALHRSRELARHVEGLGFRRFWMAEHHNMPGIASAATSVALSFVAQGTDRIRIGAGGIMLPNHAPLMIAEQFGTLESLFPGRIDLGLGRAPGSDQPTARALRRGLQQRGEDFPELLEELRGYFAGKADGDSPRAVPGDGMEIPIWLLGSSGFSAQLAGSLGLPYAAAGHFAPDALLPGLEAYRNSFRGGDSLEAPYAMVCVNVIAADDEEEARRLETSHLQSFLNLIRGRPGLLPPPVDSMDGRWDERERAMVASFMRRSIVGDAKSVRWQLEALREETQADELMVHSMIFEAEARLRSYEIVAEATIGLSVGGRAR